MTQLDPEPSKRDVAAEIADLGRRHNVIYRHTELDELAYHFSRLSDAEVTPDDTENLLIALVRAGVISDAQSMQLLGAYLRQLGYR